jgi:EmrB/QacA subfamily drug resistance transporter
MTRPERWWVLAILVAAQFIYVVDAFIVNVALPSITTDLHATASETQGIIVCYLIAFATLVVTGGRLGDIHGTKPVFLTGLLGFTAASLWCGLTQSGAELVAARTIQGASAALMIPQVLATIHRLFTGDERPRAFGIYGSALGLGAAVGFVLGGLIVTYNFMGTGWRAIFFVNVPIGLALAASAARVMPKMPGKPGTTLDITGAALLFCALLSFLGPIVIGHDLGWPIWLAGVMILGVALFDAFLRNERRVETRNGSPLIPLALLQDAHVRTGLLAVLTFTFANIAFYLLLTLHMQMALNFTPLQSGCVVIPLALTFAVVSRKSGPRAQRKGPIAIIEGCIVQVLGIAILAAALTSPAWSTPLRLSLLLIVIGIGQAMAMAPLYSLALNRIPAAYAGAGAGVLSTVQQIGNGSGAAVIGALYLSFPSVGVFACLAALALSLIATMGLLWRLLPATALRPKSA